MTDEQITEQLAKALYSWIIGPPENAWNCADRLLPIVRRAQAQALRDEAAELREVALAGERAIGTVKWDAHRVWTWLSDRADALEAER